MCSILFPSWHKQEKGHSKKAARSVVRMKITAFVLISEICWWRDFWQFAPIWAEEHNHSVSFLGRERYLPTGQFHKHAWAESHQYKHPVQPSQPLPPLKGPVSSRATGEFPGRTRTWGPQISGPVYTLCTLAGEDSSHLCLSLILTLSTHWLAKPWVPAQGFVFFFYLNIWNLGGSSCLGSIPMLLSLEYTLPGN